MFSNDYPNSRPREPNTFSTNRPLGDKYAQENLPIRPDSDKDGWNKNIWGSGLNFLTQQPQDSAASHDPMRFNENTQHAQPRPLSASRTKPFVPSMPNGAGNALRSTGVSPAPRTNQSLLDSSKPSNYIPKPRNSSAFAPTRNTYEAVNGFGTSRPSDNVISRNSLGGLGSTFDQSTRSQDVDDSRWPPSSSGRSPVDDVRPSMEHFQQSTGGASSLPPSRHGSEPFVSQYGDNHSRLPSRIPNGRPAFDRHNSYDDASPANPGHTMSLSNDRNNLLHRPTSSSARTAGSQYQQDYNGFNSSNRTQHNLADDSHVDPIHSSHATLPAQYVEQLHTSRAGHIDRQLSVATSHNTRNSPSYHSTPAQSPIDHSHHQRSDSWHSQSNVLQTDRRQRNYVNPQHQSAQTQMYLPPQYQQMIMGQYRGQFANYGQFSPYSHGLAINGMVPHMGVQQPMPVTNYGMPQTREHGNTPRDSEFLVQSQLLRDYRATHNKRDRRWELKDIYGHIVEFSGDQIGSRFLQQKLEQANSDEKTAVFKEIMPNAVQLMQDVFGNYVIQKFFEHGDQIQKRWLGEKMRNHIASLSLQMYGCRVVQKAFEYVLADQQAVLVSELNRPGLVIKCLECQHGNHVIQKAIEVIPLPHIRFIYDALFGHIGRFAEHTYGCRVVQRMLEQPDEDVRKRVLTELHSSGAKLIPDTFGNYVAQHVICHGDIESRNWMIGLVINDMETFGRHKFASNVVEKCIEHGTNEQRRQIMQKVIQVKPDADLENSGLLGYLKDQYGNYVIQTLLKHLPIPDQEYLSAQLTPVLPDARKCASKKAMDGVEELMRQSNSTSAFSTPRSSSVECGVSRNDTSSAPSPVPVEVSSATSSEGVPENDNNKSATMMFGCFPGTTSQSQSHTEITQSSIKGDDVNVQLRDMLQRTNIGTRDSVRPVLNGFRT